MIPAAPARTAGLLTIDPGDFTIWIHCLMSPGCPTIAWLTPGVLVGVNPKSLTACADSSVSFTQRPELAAIAEPVCATEAPALKAAPRRGDPAFDDRPTDAMNRSTAVGLPVTASPSPSLSSSTSSSIAAEASALTPLARKLGRT